MINKETQYLSIDIETFDPDLKDLGPGQFRKQGKILGVAIADDQGFAEYYDFEKNFDLIKDLCALDCKKIGANILYDVLWLEQSGVIVNGNLYDVIAIESLIDENRSSYSLDAISSDYVSENKANTKLIEFVKTMGWDHRHYREYLYRAPFELVREYAIQDALLPIEILKKQWPQIQSEELVDVFKLESDLLQVTKLFRSTGVHIDLVAFSKAKAQIEELIEQEFAQAKKLVGPFNPNSSEEVGTILEDLGFDVPSSPTGKHSVTGEWVRANASQHDFLGHLALLKKYNTCMSLFFEALPRFIVDGNVIHCDFHSTRSSYGGTVSGRFSASKPNLQQIPATGSNELIGNLCRSVFIPDEDCFWGKIDYSQIEYRLLAHYAVGDGAIALRHSYRTDRSTDYHQHIMNLTGLNRRYAKNINFGVMYGMGPQKMAMMFGWDEFEVERIFNEYTAAAPYVKKTVKEIEAAAALEGFIRTIGGRKCRVVDHRKLYVMFNRLIQGGAADVLKIAMVKAYKAGVFDTLSPHLTVHDELDVSIPQTSEGIEAFIELKAIMEDAVLMQVPILCEATVGKTWAEACH